MPAPDAADAPLLQLVPVPAPDPDLLLQLVPVPAPDHDLQRQLVPANGPRPRTADDLSRELRTTQRALRRSKKTNRILKQQLKHIEHANSLEIVHRGQNSKRTLTWSGSVAMALRVTIGNVSARKAHLVLLEKQMARSTVTRAEIQSRGVLKYAARCMHNLYLKLFDDGSHLARRGLLSVTETLPILVDSIPECTGIICCCSSSRCSIRGCGSCHRLSFAFVKHLRINEHK